MLFEKLKVLVAALPAQLAAVQSVLGAFGALALTLPFGWQAKALAVLASVSGIVAAAVRVVSRVKPVPPSQRGLLP